MSKTKTYKYKGETSIHAKFIAEDKPHVFHFKEASKNSGVAVFVTGNQLEQEIIEGSNAFKGKSPVISFFTEEPKEAENTDSDIDESFVGIEDFNELVKQIKEKYNIEDHEVLNSKAKLKLFAETSGITLNQKFQ